MNTNAKTLARVASYNLKNGTSIFTYVLLKIHTRDG